MEIEEFMAVFQIGRSTIFEVAYYTLSTNSSPHFATTASHFCKSKRDFDHCGQAQDDLLPEHSAARDFWEKWDARHLHRLTEEQLGRLLEDMQALKAAYNYKMRVLDTSKRPYSPHFSFYDLVDFSKQKPKRNKLYSLCGRLIGEKSSKLVDEMEEHGYHFDDISSYRGYLRFYTAWGETNFGSWKELDKYLKGVCWD